MSKSSFRSYNADHRADGPAILEHLREVDLERVKRLESPALASAVMSVKSYQQRRFKWTYHDLLGTARYGSVSKFFLDELYGPSDFSRRDAQFAKVVPTLVRLFPQEIVDTVATLAALHALSETMDSRMGEFLLPSPVTASAYMTAWQQVGRKGDRRQQIELTLDVAAALDRLTRKPMLQTTLRLMRGPARAAGLGQLQQFLEAGFDTFRAMRGADEFLAMVRSRERGLATKLFEASQVAELAGDLPEDESE